MPDKKKPATKIRKFKRTPVKTAVKPKTTPTKKPTPPAKSEKKQEVVEVIALEQTATMLQTPSDEEEAKPVKNDAPKESVENLPKEDTGPVAPETTAIVAPEQAMQDSETTDSSETQENTVEGDADQTANDNAAQEVSEETSDSEQESGQEAAEQSGEEQNSEVLPDNENVDSQQTAGGEEPTNQEGENSDVTVLEEGGGLRWLMILVILFLVGLIGGLFYLFLSQHEHTNGATTNMPSPSAAPRSSVTDTPTPTVADVAKDTYTISILNGSGVAGQAATVQTYLNGQGYKVSGVGNADNSNYSQTEIHAKKNVSTVYIDELEKDLQTKYSVNTTTATLDDSATEDVDVIIGSTTN